MQVLKDNYYKIGNFYFLRFLNLDEFSEIYTEENNEEEFLMDNNEFIKNVEKF